MRYPIPIVALALFHGLALASPLKKKDFVYDIVTDIEVVYVTASAFVIESVSATPSVSVIVDYTTVEESATTIINYNAPIPSVAAPTTTEAPTSSTEVPVPTVPASTTEVIVSPPAPVPTTSSATPVEMPSSTVVVVSSTAAVNPADASSTDMPTLALYHHNIHRTNHSVAAVVWNDTLASYAATVAASCIYAHNLTPGGGKYGQNIATYGQSGDAQALGEAAMVASATTDMWYNGEVGQYLPSFYGETNPDFSNFDGWGHFSQVVWKSTEEIGCASQYCAAGTIFSGMGSWFTVCNYGPEGNMGGEYGDNVLESLGHPSVSVNI